MSSYEKIANVLKCANSLGVFVGPIRITRVDPAPAVLIVPLQSWYHSGFDTEPNLNDPSYLKLREFSKFSDKWSDFLQCSWPGVDADRLKNTAEDEPALAIAFAQLNEPFLNSLALDAGVSSQLPVIEPASPKKERPKFDELGQLVYVTEKPSPAPAPASQASPETVFATETLESACSSLSISPGSGSGPGSSDGRAVLFGAPLVRNPEDTVISFSHFVPRAELGSRHTFYEPDLSRVFSLIQSI